MTVPIVDNETIQTFDYTVPLDEALLWQYNNAASLQSLIASKQAWYDTYQEQFWEDWFTNVFALDTADDFGLSVWAIILGQPIVFNNQPIMGQVPWGFGTSNENFNNGNFFAGTGTYTLPTEVARTLLQLRAFQLVSSGTVPETNRMLAYVFGDMGSAWLVDNYDMTQTYMFDFALSADLQWCFNNIDILPRPAGVSSTYEVI